MQCRIYAGDYLFRYRKNILKGTVMHTEKALINDR